VLDATVYDHRVAVDHCDFDRDECSVNHTLEHEQFARSFRVVADGDEHIVKLAPDRDITHNFQTTLGVPYAVTAVTPATRHSHLGNASTALATNVVAAQEPSKLATRYRKCDADRGNIELPRGFAGSS
jgi:hypothetical protein